MNFVYPEGGYFYYTTERAHVSVRVVSERCAARLDAEVVDYEDNPINRFSAEIICGEERLVDIPVEGKRLGYYKVTVSLTDGTDVLEKSTGVGITTEYEALPAEESKFGLNTNSGKANVHFAAIAKMGIRMIRRTWPNEYILCMDELKKYGLKVLAQWSGGSTAAGSFRTAQQERFAPPLFNSAFQLQ